jgi:8-oxo-dGTP pyrophosphatase MutT (NUDIX family)
VHRAPLLALLDGYVARYPDEAPQVARWRAFVGAHEDCLGRGCIPGHVTGSAWILSPDRRSVLLTRHRKLGRWLQLGGHADGERDVLAVALREAREESGLVKLEPIAAGAPGGAPVPLDLDVHEIPARADDPAHLHWDVRFLIQAAAAEELVVSEESTDLRWVRRDLLRALVDEESLLRMERKTRALLGEDRAVEREGRASR